MTHKVNPLLAKLLAKEDLTVQHGNYSTAWFDVKHRILGLPNWKNMTKDVYDMLVGHEVGHALYTPESGFHDNNETVKGCPKSYLNIIEDARIERFIQRDYPGLVSCFSKAYTILFEDGIFGDISVSEVPHKKLIDRINLKAKLGSRLEVPFDDKEQLLFDRAMTNQTWEEVCDLVRDIVALEDMNEDDDQTPDQENQSENNDESEGNRESNSADNNDGEISEEHGEYSSESDDEVAGVEVVSEASEKDEDEEEPIGNDGTEGIGNNYVEQTIEEDRIAETDQEFRNNEKDLLDTNEDGKMVYTFDDYNRKEVANITISYRELKKKRQEAAEKSSISTTNTDSALKLLSMLTKIKMKEINKTIQPAVREFETKKAAYEYQRSLTSNRGVIDVNKLHSYRYNEDIFSSITVKADAQNHGMFMLLDLSGSMHSILPEVIEQTLSLIAFCKATSIPFKLYGFTTGNSQSRYDIERPYNVDFRDSVLDTMSCSLVELANSDLKKKDMEEALCHIFLKGFCVRNEAMHLNIFKSQQEQDLVIAINGFIRIPQLCYVQARCEQLGATPFSQALIASRHLLLEFKKKHAIQKLNFITLCDGDAVDMGSNFKYDDHRSEAEQEASSNIEYDYRKINIRVGSDVISTTGRVYYRRRNPEVRTKDSKLASKIMSSIKKQLGITTQGFFVADTNSQFNYRIVGSYHTVDSKLLWDQATNDTLKKKAQKEYRKNKCVEIPGAHGYDAYFVVKSGKDLSIDSEFDVDDGAKASQIKNAFVKYSKGKKTNKVLLEKFARSIC